MARVVVGVDGSETSIEALRQAIAAARERGATVDAVVAWHFPGITMLPGPEDVPTPTKLEEQARAHLDSAVAAVGSAAEGVEIRSHVVQGHPADVLMRAADGADLLVVGARGTGGFRGLLIGSVSNQVVHHATCPVLVARLPR